MLKTRIWNSLTFQRWRTKTFGCPHQFLPTATQLLSTCGNALHHVGWKRKNEKNVIFGPKQFSFIVIRFRIWSHMVKSEKLCAFSSLPEHKRHSLSKTSGFLDRGQYWFVFHMSCRRRLWWALQCSKANSLGQKFTTNEFDCSTNGFWEFGF